MSKIVNLCSLCENADSSKFLADTDIEICDECYEKKITCSICDSTDSMCHFMAVNGTKRLVCDTCFFDINFDYINQTDFSEDY